MRGTIDCIQACADPTVYFEEAFLGKAGTEEFA